MNIRQKRKLLAQQLKESLVDLEKAARAIVYSESKCLVIGQKDAYDLEEQEVFEALTARFARASDILTQQVLKTVFALLQEHPGTKPDSANLAEKLGIIPEADILLNIRELRNQIAHEYVRSHLNTLFMDVLRYVPDLIAAIEGLKSYSQRFFSEDGTLEVGLEK